MKGTRGGGVRTGHWLSRAQTEQLLALPDTMTNKGKRDRVVLAVLVGCGLRRTELVQLMSEQIQQLDGRWVVANLIGKGNRLRTVPIVKSHDILYTSVPTHPYTLGTIRRPPFPLLRRVVRELEPGGQGRARFWRGEANP